MSRYVLMVLERDSHGEYFTRKGPAYKESTARRKMEEHLGKAYITKYGSNDLVDANFKLHTPHGVY